MQVPYVTDAEIAAFKRLSRSERDDLKRQIIAAHPNSLFGTAKPSNNPNVAFIVCPNCGNGSGKDHTPVQCNFIGDRWLYHCFARQDLEGDLLNLIADAERLTLSNADDMAKALTIGASMIGYNFNERTGINHKLTFKKVTRSNSDNFNLAKDKSASQSASQSDSQPNLQSFSQIKGTSSNSDNFPRLAESRSNLQMQGTSSNSEYYKKTFRGLSRATLVKLNWGFLKNYKHPLNTFVFQAIIIPNDKGGILARAIEGTQKSNISPTGTTTICLPTDNQILFIVEGAIDAASIAQATDFQYGVIAIGGTSGRKNCVERLTELYPNGSDALKNIVMLDHDSDDPEKDAGQIAAQKLVAELNQLGFAVVNKIICETPHRDPNLILQEEGDEALRMRIENIVAETQDQFDAILAEKKAAAAAKVNVEPAAKLDADDKITQWQKVNGVIEPKLLAALMSFAEKINAVEDFAEAATDTSTVKFLGYCRFYPFAHVEQKFFRELRAAVDKAKSKVKAWGKHIKDTDKYNAACIGAKRELDLSKKPAESDFNLAAINPRILSEKADSYANKAKKEHEKWLVQKRIDEINEKRQAEREAYEDAPPSTQQFVEDCPIDLILPLGAIFTDVGVQYVDWGKPAKEGRPYVVVCQNPIVPTKFLFNAATGIVHYEIAIKVDNKWRVQVFEARTFMDAKNILALTNYGAKISEPRLLSKFFSKLLQDNELNDRLPKQRLYSQPGWHDGEFISPTGGEGYIVKRDGIDYAALFAQKGNPDDWLDLFKKIFHLGEELHPKEYAALQIIAFVFGYALSASTLKINGLPNQQLHIWGNKSSGKTAVLKFALSIFGDPTEGKLLRSMAATDKNKLAIAAGLNDFPVGYDEVESANKFSDLEKACYDFFSGVVNQANKRNGEVRAAEHFRGVQIMTGENPILDVDTAKGGSLKRLVQIQISQPLLPVEDARQLHVFLNNNHGHFRQAWIDYVKTHADELQADFENIIKVIEIIGSETNSDGKLYFSRDNYEQTNFFAITNSFVAFFHFLIMLGIKDSFDINETADCIISIMRLLPTADELDDYSRALLLIQSFIDGKSKFFYREAYDVDNTVAKHESLEKYGILFETGDVAFFPAFFKIKVWDELGVDSSYGRFLADAYTAGHLICHDSGDKRRSIRYKGKKIKVYYFKAAAFDFDDSSDKSD